VEAVVEAVEVSVDEEVVLRWRRRCRRRRLTIGRRRITRLRLLVASRSQGRGYENSEIVYIQKSAAAAAALQQSYVERMSSANERTYQTCTDEDTAEIHT